MIDSLKGYAQHGVHLTPPSSGDFATGTCPLCGKDKHFRVHQTEIYWKCMRCGENGDFPKFLQTRMRQYRKQLRGKAILDLEKHRGIPRGTLRRWHVGYDDASGMCMIPMQEGSKTVNIHRYDPKTGKMLSTTGGRNALICADPPDDAGTVWVCEGEWDAMALDEALRGTGSKEGVVAVPGAANAGLRLLGVLQGKHVILAFDNDGAGDAGDDKARKALAARARTLISVHWPEGTGSGFDVRDLWLQHDKNAKRFLKALRSLLHEEPRPQSMSGQADAPVRPSAPAQPTGSGLARDEVVAAYREWLYLPDAEVIDLVFGTILANRIEGDPLWLFLVGPPGCGKGELVMSLYEAPLIFPASTMTPAALVSGQQLTGADDPSFIPKWNGKVVAVKDFTVVLKMNQIAQEEIFSILRDAYDGRIDKPFGNGVHRIYHSRFGFVAGVTAKIEEYGPTHSVVGERFVKYYMRKDQHINVGTTEIDTAIKTIGRETKMRKDLADVARKALNREVSHLPDLGDELPVLFRNLAQWAAAMRGAVTRDKYSKELIHKPTAEIGTRLAKQLCKLAMGVAMFRGKRRVSAAEFRLAARVARDSAPDIVEEIVRQLYVRERDDWTETGQLAEWTRFDASTVQTILGNLLLLRVVQKEKGMKARWRLSRSVIRLMQPLNLYAKEKQWGRK